MNSLLRTRGLSLYTEDKILLCGLYVPYQGFFLYCFLSFFLRAFICISLTKILSFFLSTIATVGRLRRLPTGNRFCWMNN